MITICCVCHKVLKREKKDYGVISHGYCKKHLKEFRAANGLKQAWSKIRHNAL